MLLLNVCVNGYVIGILSATPMRPDNLVFYIPNCQSICVIHHRETGQLNCPKDLALT